MEKQRLLYQQARLHNRGAAEMVLQMISACKGALHKHLAPEHTHPVFPLPNPPIFCGPSSTLSHPCISLVYTHTPALACSTCLVISYYPSATVTLAHTYNPFSYIPRDGHFLVDEEHHSQTKWTIFCSLPPAGETGAMVSSTLKLGISILNGGNADVQQVVGKGSQEES